MLLETAPRVGGGEELGTGAPGPLSLGGGGGRPRRGARLLFPACPGEPPSPRGRSGSPTRREEPVSAWPRLKSLFAPRPLGSICTGALLPCLPCLRWLSRQAGKRPSGASASAWASGRGEGRGSGGPQNPLEHYPERRAVGVVIGVVTSHSHGRPGASGLCSRPLPVPQPDLVKDTESSSFCVGFSQGSDFQSPDTSPSSSPCVGTREEEPPEVGAPGELEVPSQTCMPLCP